MVIGHTPQEERPLVRCGGRLQIIDTGISRAYYGRASGWECRAGQLWEVTPEGRRPLPSGIAEAATSEGGGEGQHETLTGAAAPAAGHAA